jgi:hypothetical protein
MKLTRCPICHSNIHLDALVSDDAGRELLGEVANLSDIVARPILAYIGLFRPAKQDLTNARALKLIREVLAAYRADHILASALAETAQKIREKRTACGDVKPLANHNYLKQVYQSLATKLGGSPKGKSSTTPEQTKLDDSDWYFEQAKRLQSMGKDPLQSTIAQRLKELNWKA